MYLFEKAFLFHDHGVMHVRAEGFLYRVHIGCIAVRSDLRPVQNAASKISQQRYRVLADTFPQAIAHNHFGLRVKGQPEVTVALLWRIVRLDVMLLLLDERSRLVEFQERNLEVAHGGVMETVTCPAHGVFKCIIPPSDGWRRSSPRPSPHSRRPAPKKYG